MNESILVTKLHRPPIDKETILNRPRLTALLNNITYVGMTTVVAPAGFGKSTLIAGWLASSPRRASWLSLSPQDNETLKFWHYIYAALGQIDDDLVSEAQKVLSQTGLGGIEAATIALINPLTMYNSHIYLILDDYHVITDESIHDSLQFLIDNQPPSLHLIIITRIDPPLKLARLRSRRQLLEIRVSDLQFTSAEAANLMNGIMNLHLDSGQIEALTRRTEGWVAGLQLVALSLKAQSDQAAFIEEFAASRQYIMEYLTEEVLSTLPDDLRQFLMQTAILDRLCVDLCRAVIQMPNVDAKFEEIRKRNLFLIALDNENVWFRYHHLFADLLRARTGTYFPQEAIGELHNRASQWFEEKDSLPDAIHHAFLAGDEDRVASLVDKAGQTMIFVDHATLKTWLAELDQSVFENYPRLEIYRTLIALSQGALDMSEATLLEKEQLIQALPPSPENDTLRLAATTYLCLFMAHQNTSRTIQLAERTLTELPEKNLKFRSFLYSALYRGYGMQGELDKATPAYQECLRLSSAIQDYGMVSVTTMVRAFDMCQYGRLDEAATYCQTIIDVGSDMNRTFYQAGPSHIGLGGIQLERFELDAAEHNLTLGMELCRRSGMDGLYTGNIQYARLLQARQDYEAALEVLYLLEKDFQRWDFTLTARQVSLRIAMGDFEEASRLAAPLQTVLSDSAYAQRLPLIAQEAFKVCLARIALVEGDLVQARSYLDEIQPTAELDQRLGRLLEIYLLRALIEQYPGSQSHALPQAIPYVQQALQIAEQCGFFVLILEEAPAIVPLLQAVTGPLQSFAQRVLAAYSDESDANSVLIEELTPRELEVLQCLATGDSNQIIADKLFITVRTVKKHVTNILGKLNADNRTHAVIKAREKGLISFD